jgi:hypothetical protein
MTVRAIITLVVQIIFFCPRAHIGILFRSNGSSCRSSSVEKQEAIETVLQVQIRKTLREKNRFPPVG